jgi:DNA replication ATP-dependent helicase Dna2
MPSAPLAISSQSRKKLKQFQFAETSAEVDADKENFNSHPSLQDSRCDAPETLPYASENTQPKSQGICPHTPASKIPLAALIGNTEDAFNGVNFDTTPEDHVSWQHGPRSSDTVSSSRSTQRGKKRARSSSPASSSQIEKPNHFSGQKEPLDLQNLQQSLKTPQHDPTTDLWARYSTASLAKANADNAALAPFAQLITSSPQTPNTINSRESGLQRSISCGIEWPTSRKKRRKLDTVDTCGRIRDLFESSKQDHFSGQEPVRSRVELLIGKIKDSMQRKQSVLARGPSSSSPLPDRADVFMHRNASPSPKKRAREGLSAPDAKPKQGSNTLGASKLNHHCIAGDDGSSEYGDADLDLNFLETISMTGTQMMLEKELINCEAQNSPVALNGPINVDAGTDQLRHEKHKPSRRQNNVRRQASPSPQITIQHESDDEFAIEDDSAFATEMQDLAERYDTEGTTFSACATGPQAAQAHHLDSALNGNMQRTSVDDAYENDFDDDDDLWDGIGNASFSHPRGTAVGSASQVRAFHRSFNTGAR